MTGLFLRYRARMLLGALRPASRRDWGILGLVAFFVLVYSPMIILMYTSLQLVAERVAEVHGLGVLQRLMYLPAATHGIVLLFLILNRVYPILLESSDRELLRSLPVPAPQLARARLTMLAVALVPVALVFAPLAAFYGHEAGAGLALAGWIALLLAAYLALLVGLGGVVTALLARLLSPVGLRRLSRYGTLIVLFPAAMAASLFLPHLRQVPAAVDLLDLPLRYAGHLSHGPSAWLVDGLAAAASGRALELLGWCGLIGASAVVAWWAALALAGPLLEADAIDPEATRPSSRAVVGMWAPSWLGAASRAIWRREVGAVLVEAPRTILPFLAMFALFTFMGRIGSGAMPLSFMLPFFGIMMASNVCMMSVGQEGEAFWIIRTLPVPMWRVLVVKLAVRLTATILVMGLLAGIVALVSPSTSLPIDASELPVVVPLFAVSLGIAAVWSLATGARFPRFRPTRKGQHVGVAASLCGTFGSLIIVATILLSVLPMKVEALRPMLWFLPLVVPAFWLGVVALYLAWASWHLERLEE